MMIFNAALAACLVGACIARPVHNHAALHRLHKRGLGTVASANTSEILGRDLIESITPIKSDDRTANVIESKANIRRSKRAPSAKSQATRDLIAKLDAQEKNRRTRNSLAQKSNPLGRRDGEEGSDPVNSLLRLVTSVTDILRRERMEMHKRELLNGEGVQVDETGDPINALLHIVTGLTGIIKRDAVYMKKRHIVGSSGDDELTNVVESLFGDLSRDYL